MGPARGGGSEGRQLHGALDFGGLVGSFPVAGVKMQCSDQPMRQELGV